MTTKRQKKNTLCCVERSFREPGKKLEYGETRMGETMQADEVAVDLLSKNSIQGQQKNKHI